MHMKQPSSLTAATKVNNSQMIPTYGQTFDSLNARESSYDGRMGGRQKPSGLVSDRINVRIRGKNNAV